MDDESNQKTGWHLPGWVRELTLKVLYVVVPLLTIAAVNLYIDTLNLKKDISREIWRNDQQDARLDRHAIKQERTEDAIADLKDNLSGLKDDQSDFQDEALHRLDVLLEKNNRDRR